MVCTNANTFVMLCILYAGSFMEFQWFEVKPEDDSNNVTECLHEDKPNTGMFAGSGKQVLFLCTAFAFVFQSFYF